MILKSNDFIEFEAKMCQYNDLDVFVPFRVVNSVDSHELIYDTSRCRTLIQELESSSTIDEENFIHLLVSMGKAINYCSNYLLDETHIDLDIAKTYYDGTNYKFMYLPSPRDCKMKELIRDYVKQLQAHINQNSSICIEKMHQLTMALGETHFDLQGLVDEILIGKVPSYE